MQVCLFPTWTSGSSSIKWGSLSSCSPPSMGCYEGLHNFKSKITKNSTPRPMENIGRLATLPPNTPFWGVLSKGTHGVYRNYMYYVKGAISLRTSRLPPCFSVWERFIWTHGEHRVKSWATSLNFRSQFHHFSNGVIQEKLAVLFQLLSIPRILPWHSPPPTPVALLLPNIFILQKADKVLEPSLWGKNGR